MDSKERGFRPLSSVAILIVTAAALLIAVWGFVNMRSIRHALSDRDRRVIELQKQLARFEEPTMNSNGGQSASVREVDSSANKLSQRETDGRGSSAPKPGQILQVVQELRNDPEFQRVSLITETARINRQYASLFAQMDPAAAAALKGLLVEEHAVMEDIMFSIRLEGLDPNTSEGRRLLSDMAPKVHAEFRDKIKQAIGSEDHNRYLNYEQTAPQRNTVNALQEKFTWTDDRLTPQQAEELVKILTLKPEGGRVVLPLNGAPAIPILDTDISLMAKVLTPTQVAQARELQLEQQAAKQLSSMIGAKIKKRG